MYAILEAPVKWQLVYNMRAYLNVLKIFQDILDIIWPNIKIYFVLNNLTYNIELYAGKIV